MRDVQSTLRRQHESHRFSHVENSCNGVDNISIIVHKKKVKNRKLYDLFKIGQPPAVAFRLSRSGMHKTRKLLTKHSSLPTFNKKTRTTSKQHTKSSDAILKKKNCFSAKFIVNRVSGYNFNEFVSPFNFPTQRRWKVYRCQLSSQEDSCCCSCNSDAMFEVMKSLYDCYKKKNCDNCNCILCGHLPQEERRLGEIKKSMASLGIAAKERKVKIKKAEKALIGKSAAEKEKVLKDLALTGEPLPEGKTASEKALIQKVRTDFGLPPEPKTASEKARMRKAEEAGVMTPLEGKTASQKEKILKAQTQLGIPLPEGRTESEKALIQKVKTAAGIPTPEGRAVSEKAIIAKVKAKTAAPSEKMQKAKAAGLLTPLEGKKPEEKEKILKGRAMQGFILPEPKTSSERKLTDKVRVDLGLPPEPKTTSMKDRYSKAANAGLLRPLEGQSPKEKEKILQGLHDMGVPLPEGRTASEKALVAKVKAGPKAPTALAPSEKIPVPEGRTPSEKKLIAKAKVSKREPPPSAVLAPSEKLRKAKAAGLLTPLEGKTAEQKEKILKGLAKQGISLPEGKTVSEKKIIDKVRADLVLPPEPKSASMREKYIKAADAGLLQPLEGKTHKEKEKIIQGLQEMGIPLPEGHTASEKALVAKAKAAPQAPPVLAPSEKIGKAKPVGVLTPVEGKVPSEKAPISKVLAPSEKLRKAKAAGLLTPLAGKSPAQRENILRGLAMHSVPLPEGQTSSEKMLINKVRADLGLPPEPKTPSMKEKYAKAANAGLLQPLEGKSAKEKERILQGLQNAGIPLPEGRTASEKALVAKVKAATGVPSVTAPSEKIKKAKAAGLLTPLEGKTPSQKEKIIKGLAMQGLPLPEGKTASERKLIDKARKDLGLPPEAKTGSMKEKYAKAANAGLMQPLEGKSAKEKERLLRGLQDTGIPLPEGRTASEKALITKVKALPRAPSMLVPSEKLRAAKAAGLLTPLEGKTPSQKEKILRGLAAHDMPLPEGKTASERKLVDKVKADVGRPPAPKTAVEKEKLPEERIARRKSLAAGVGAPALPPDQRRKLDEKTAKLVKEGKGPVDECICGLLTPELGREPEVAVKTPSGKVRPSKAAPLEGKTPEQKEKILRGLIKQGVPLPEAKTASEKVLVDKIRADVRLPPEPKTPSMKEKYKKAQASGVITPLEGKTMAQKEKILKRQAELGLALPEGRTASEKELIAKLKTTRAPSITSEKLRKAKAAGLLTPLEGKSPEQKDKILRGLAKSGLPLPEGRTASEKAMVKQVKAELGIPERTSSEKLRKAKTAGLLTPLEGKTKSQKEKIMRGRAVAGLPLPSGKTPSEKVLIKKIREDTGYVTPSPSEKMKKAKAAGLLTPLEGKTRSAKEKILRERVAAGIPIEEGKTPSEKEIIKAIIAKEPPTAKRPSEKLRQAKAAGALTPLEGKTKEQKEKIIKGLVKAGLPMPDPKTASEKNLMDRIRQEVGLPPEPKTSSMKAKYKKAHEAGIVTPLEGKSKAEKEKALKKLYDAGIPLPEGRTPSEKSIVKRIKAKVPERKISSEKIRAAKAAGLLTPLEGKTASQKEKIVTGLAKSGLPLPEGKTASEKELVAKVKAETKPPTKITSEKFKKAKAAGLLTPLTGKPPKEKERILKGLVEHGLPLPEAQTASEKKIATKVRKELGLPPEPTTLSEKEKIRKATGLVTPLEGKTASQKERIVRGMAEAGIKLPEGRTASEKDIIKKVQAEVVKPKPIAGPPALPPEQRAKLDEKTAKVMKEGKGPSDECICGLLTPESEREKPLTPKIPSEKIKKTKTAGLLSPLEGKTAADKEKKMKGLVKQGLPLPETKTASEKKIADKIRKELGLPSEPKTASMKEKHEKAAAAGVLVPLEGLSSAEKEKVLRGQADLGIALPEGRTASEKALISKLKAVPPKIPSEKMKSAKAAGLLTPLEGKTAKEKEKIMRGLAKKGLPMPETKTASEKKMADKIRKELGMPTEPKTASMKEKSEKAAAEAEQRPSKVPSEKLRKAKAAGLLTPLEGKTEAQKEKIVRKLADAGLPLPEGKTASEKVLIQKVRADLGMPPPAKTASEKAVVRKAKAEGLLTPLTGKPAKEKERILKGLAEAGLPLPEGKTASEKELVKKVRTAAGMPPEPTPSEKRGEKKTKSKKVGITPSKKLKTTTMATGVAGIAEEFEDIIKTTTCDRGCGCDKKKIRFKHSYVKIRVTSPDISSLCPCPNECLPGVKAGAFIDNEGIKVTVGRVAGVISYTNQLSNHTLETPKNIVTLYDKIQTNSCSSNTSTDTIHAHVESTVETSILKRSLYETCPSLRYTNFDDKLDIDNDTVTYTSESCDSRNSRTYEIESNKSYECENSHTASDDTSTYAESSRDILKNSNTSSNESTTVRNSSGGSFDSVLVIKSESSLSLTTNSSTSTSMDAASAISLSNCSNSTASSPYLYCLASDGHSAGEETERFTTQIDCFRTDDSGNGTETCDTVVSVAHFDRSHSGNLTEKQNEYLTYRLSHSEYQKENKMYQNTRKIDNHEPVIVINNLNSEHDITAMVDQLLSSNEFSDASSIFLVVPTSDDNDSELSSDSLSSTLCIQLSEHYGNFYQKYFNKIRSPEVTSRRDSSNTRGVRISARGKKFCLEGMQEAVSFHDKETMFNYKLPFYSRHVTEEPERTKNKLCQITTPTVMLRKVYRAVSTDTTSDRPCCCAQIESPRYHNRHSEHRCVANVVSEVIPPIFRNKGLSSEMYPRFPKENVTQQVSFLSINEGTTSVVPCQIPPCAGTLECHSPDDQRAVPRSPDLSYKPYLPSKPISGMKQSEPCQCNPEQLKQLLEQAMKIGKSLNMKSTGCGGPVDNVQATDNVTGKDEECGACSQPKHNDDLSMQCTCSGKKKKVKLRSLCPCEQQQPPISQAITGPKSGTRSLGCQCCVCENSSLKAGKKAGAKMCTASTLGPAGGLCKIEPGGTYTQAGMSEEQNEKPRKECACKNKKGKKNKNVICECPPAEPEPELEDLLYAQYAGYQWVDEQQVLRQKSDMTQTHSGFKMFKKKKPPPPPEAEVTVEDAVRYYVTMNPEVLRDLVPPPQTDDKDCSCEDDKKGKKRKKLDCSCANETPPPPPEPEPKPEPEPQGPLGGLKFSIFGKGSGSKGLSGVCCFDMMQETRDTTQETWISKKYTNE